MTGYGGENDQLRATNAPRYINSSGKGKDSGNKNKGIMTIVIIARVGRHISYVSVGSDNPLSRRQSTIHPSPIRDPSVILPIAPIACMHNICF